MARHCLDRPEERLFLSQALLGRPTPKMLVHIMEINYCVPLIRKPGLLYRYTNAVIGGIAYISPVLNAYGPKFEITPLSFLQLRWDALFFHYWTLPWVKGVGFFPLNSYNAPYNDSALEKLKGKSASGFLSQLRLTLRGRVKLGRRVVVAVLDTFWFDYWWLDQNVYYKNIPRDVVLGKSDFVLVNTLTLLVGSELTRNLVLFVGGQHEWTFVPKHPYVSHLLSGMLVLEVSRLGRVARNLRAFVQLGSYVRHAFRSGRLYTGMGLMVDYELGK